MGIKSKVEQKSTVLSYIAKAVARTLQFALAVAVAGLYGYRLSADRSTGDETPHKWIYAEVVAGMSAATAIIYMIPFVKTHVLFVWDMMLFILWTVTFGIFAVIYLHRADDNPYQNTNTGRMRAAVWLDMINMILWFVTGVYGGVMFLLGRKKKTLHTGRASV